MSSAAVAAKAPPKGSDLEKDVHALVELQDKLNTHNGLAQMTAQQLQRASIAQKRTELTLQELGHIGGDVPTYKQVGKAYLLEPMQAVLDELQGDLAASKDEVSRLSTQQQHALKALAATEAELRELFKSQPELGRQLAAAAGP